MDDKDTLIKELKDEISELETAEYSYKNTISDLRMMLKEEKTKSHNRMIICVILLVVLIFHIFYDVWF